MSATSAHSRPQNQDTSDGEANRKVFSIPELLNLNPGFSTSRKNKQLSLGSLYEESGLNTPLSGNRGRSPLFSGSPRTSLGPRSSIPFPVSKTDGDSTKNENACRRASTNDPDFNDRRRSSFTDNVTAAQVPRSSRAGSFALSRGLAIATVKTVYQRGDASVPQSARGVISVQEEGTISPGFPLNTAASIMSLAEKQQQVPRMDIVLCKFYHTEGLSCTSRPCRFVHEILRSPRHSPATATFRRTSVTSEGSNGAITLEVDEGEEEKFGELVEVFPMSGGGGGAGSKFSKNKYKTVPCRDFAAGLGMYGDYCSFVHESSSSKRAAGENGNVDLPTSQDETTDGEAVAPPSQENDREREQEPRPTTPAIEHQGIPDTTHEETPKRSFENKKNPTKFQSSAILIPTYKWSKDEGLKVTDPASATSPAFRNIDVNIDWSTAVSPRTVVSPPQYALAPPASAWTRGPPSSMLSQRSDRLQTPHLPISAYTFSTESAPATPEAGVPYHENAEVVQEEESSPSSPLPPPPRLLQQKHQMNMMDPQQQTMELPPVYDLPPYHPWLAAIPLQHPNVLAHTSGRALAKDLRRLAQTQLPPQVPQKKTNYRTRPCKYFMHGTCPHGDTCTYSHKVEKRESKYTTEKDIPQIGDRFRTEPCKFFNSAEGCRAGDACPFIHQFVVPYGIPMVLRPRPWRTKPCRHFQTGTCLAGDLCHFAHIAENSPSSAPTDKTQTQACKYFNSAKGCPKGDKCRSQHETSTKAAVDPDSPMDNQDLLLEHPVLQTPRESIDEDDIEIVQTAAGNARTAVPVAV